MAILAMPLYCLNNPSLLFNCYTIDIKIFNLAGGEDRQRDWRNWRRYMNKDSFQAIASMRSDLHNKVKAYNPTTYNCDHTPTD